METNRARPRTGQSDKGHSDKGQSDKGQSHKELSSAGIRELRNSVSALVRRAAGGERIVITVDGRPTAQLGPLEPDNAGMTLEDLAAAGLISAPGQPGDLTMPAPFPLPADVRLDRLIDQIRGA